jgi:hypothetical protein
MPHYELNCFVVSLKYSIKSILPSCSSTNSSISTLIPQTRPELSQPWVRVLRHILLQYRPVERRDTITRHVVQRILLVWPSTHRVRHRLNVVTNLLVNHELDVLDLSIFDTVLIAVVRVNLMDGK